MKPIALPLAALVLVLAGCATKADAPEQADSANDCAVIAAVAREHYRFNTTDNRPPPLWLDDQGSGWAPRCDWGRYGVSFPEIYGSAAEGPQDGGRRRMRWVSFKQPHYDGQGAVIEAGILQGPLAGIGVECRLRSGVAGWTVSECRHTWIS